MPSIVTNKEFNKRVRVLHKNKIKALEPYANSNQKIKFRCYKGHVWYATPSQVTNTGRGCAKCANVAIKIQDEFEAEIKNIRPDVCITGKYINDSSNIEAKCKNCKNIWITKAYNLRTGCGCPKCGVEYQKNQPHRLTHRIFLEKLRFYNPTLVPKEKYQSLGVPIRAVCKKCKRSQILNLNNALYRSVHNCTAIYATHSRASIGWLEYESKRRRIKIQHFENAGEHKIQGTNWKVDGYNARLNLVFEYLGDYWHRDVRATMNRLRKIKSYGYTVIYIWHSDYVKGLAATKL